MYALGGLTPTPGFWTTPLGMKRFLKIGEADPILPQHIALLEPKMKVGISVDGFPSTSSYPKQLTLTYKNGHYSYFAKKSDIVKIWKQGKKLVMYQKLSCEDGDHFLTYDGNELVADFTLTHDQMRYDSEFVYKQAFGFSDTENAQLNELKISDAEEYSASLIEFLGECMVRSYDSYVKDCEHLKSISDGNVDVAANGYSIKDTALSIFSKFVNAYHVEPVDDKEYAILSSIKNYGLLYAKPSTITGRCIDGNSFYPSIMNDTKLFIPLGNPEYKVLDQLSDVVAYGLYRAEISGHDERLFLLNPKKWYTYIDIKEAVARGYIVSLVCDGNCNHVHYASRDRESAYYLFRGFVDLLYPLKKKNPLVKKILNILWGALCQRCKKYNDAETDYDSFDFVDVSEETDEIEGFVKEEKYKLAWARCGIFITAMGRKKMADFIAPFVDDVYRVHTDGFYTTNAQEIYFSDELGGWKLEDEGTFRIENLNTIVKIL